MRIGSPTTCHACCLHLCFNFEESILVQTCGRANFPLVCMPLHCTCVLQAGLCAGSSINVLMPACEPHSRLHTLPSDSKSTASSCKEATAVAMPWDVLPDAAGVADEACLLRLFCGRKVMPDPKAGKGSSNKPTVPGCNAAAAALAALCACMVTCCKLERSEHAARYTLISMADYRVFQAVPFMLIYIDR